MPERSNRTPSLPTGEILGFHPTAWTRRAEEIGRSRENRPILGFEIGRGAGLVTVIGGCHADEPVGPALLGRLAGFLSRVPGDDLLLRDHTWRIVPHVNPDGEKRNRAWTRERVEVADHMGRPDHGYDLFAYLRSAVRESPGDDIEFGFPGGDAHESTLRPENRAVAEFLARRNRDTDAAIRLHGSFHGMGLSTGPWFLLEPSWTERTASLRRRLTRTTETMGYRLFDVDRRGEKGFHLIAPGFSTRPASRAMREFFVARGETDMVRKFQPNSMEFARCHGDDPLTLVSEMPLFLVGSLPDGRVEPEDLEQVRGKLLRAATEGRAALETAALSLRITPMPLRDQMRLQLRFLEEGLEALRSPRRAEAGT